MGPAEALRTIFRRTKAERILWDGMMRFLYFFELFGGVFVSVYVCMLEEKISSSNASWIKNRGCLSVDVLI
jgi:hypothetical protein